MSEVALAEALQNLPAVGQLVKDRGYRQVWRFEFGGRAYFLKYYPRDATTSAKRLIAGTPAMREFARLIALQNAKIPSPRAVAVLRGYKIDGRLGDAVILEAIEPSIQLDRYLNDCDLQHGGRVPDRHRLTEKLIELVYLLGRNKLGHSDLHLGNILLSNGNLYLLDGYAVDIAGLKLKHVMMLGHAAGRWATRADILRGWKMLRATEDRPPAKNNASPRLHAKFLQRTRGENAYFGRLEIGEWRGHFVKGLKLPRWWSPASRLRISAEDWKSQWPRLLARIEADEPDVIKRTAGGCVMADRLTLGGQEVEVILKRPRRKTLWRQINSLGRRGKARRSWFKAWSLIIRDFATEWPLLLMEHKKLGYTIDSVLVVARVAGSTLADVNLDGMCPTQRETLFRRVGRTLRRLETLGFAHFDAKSSNWIVMHDAARGPVPVMIDVDGVRHYRWDGAGIQRLLRAMKEHPQYTPEDSKHLCLGYAPFARIVAEPND